MASILSQPQCVKSLSTVNALQIINCPFGVLKYTTVNKIGSDDHSYKKYLFENISVKVGSLI